ncbi:MAG: hypothetical protein AB8H80_23975 [Planctomycetota bacterium]
MSRIPPSTCAAYVLTDGASPIVPPTNAATAFLNNEIDSIALGFTMPSPEGDVTDIALSSNGWLSFDSTVVDTDLSESVAELLNDTWSRLAFLWDDLDPSVTTGTGSINLEQVSASQFRITFTGVEEVTTGGANTVQVALFDSGVIEVRYGACSVLDCLVGVSPGFGAVDLGGFDFSNLGQLGAVTIETKQAPFFDQVELVPAIRPVIGASWDLTTNNVDAISPVAITFIGLPSAVASPLDGLGATGCEGLLSVIGGSLAGTVTAGSATVSVPLPNDPALLNFVAAAQSVGLTLNNAANFYTSNGVEGSLGN